MTYRERALTKSLFSSLCFGLCVCIVLLASAYAHAADSCPANCKKWFDGCNNCDCANGSIGNCTRMLCSQPQPARCIDPPSAAAPTARVVTNEEGCLAYARAAVDQYFELKAAGCNCWNGRWHNNYEVHQNWCLSLLNWNVSRPEFDLRRTDIARCKGGRRPC